MKQRATVVSILPDGRAEVSVIRRSACGGECGSCHGCDGMEERPVKVPCDNALAAQVGEQVVVESQSGAILKMALIVYLLPFIAFFLLYLVGATLHFSEGVSIVIGFIGFILSFLLARRLNHQQSKFETLSFQIVERVER